MWVMRLLLHQRKLMNDIGIASLTLSMLTIIPPLLVMSVIDRVVGHHSMSTLSCCRSSWRSQRSTRHCSATAGAN